MKKLFRLGSLVLLLALTGTVVAGCSSKSADADPKDVRVESAKLSELNESVCKKGLGDPDLCNMATEGTMTQIKCIHMWLGSMDHLCCSNNGQHIRCFDVSKSGTK